MTHLDNPAEYEAEIRPNFIQHGLLLIVVCAICLVGNTVATDNTIMQGLVGLSIIFVIVMVGLALTFLVPINLPSVAWISLVGIVVTLP